MQFFEGNDRTGQAELFLRAVPVTTLSPDARVAVRLDTPPGVSTPGPWPVTFGMPFPAGVLWDVDGLRLEDQAGREIPCQDTGGMAWDSGWKIRPT